MMIELLESTYPYIVSISLSTTYSGVFSLRFFDYRHDPDKIRTLVRLYECKEQVTCRGVFP